jgi:hypothetical protein
MVAVAVAVTMTVLKKNDKNDGSIFLIGCGTPQEYWVE